MLRVHWRAVDISPLVGERPRGDGVEWRRQKTLGRLRMREERLHLPPQGLIAPARRRHEGGATGRVTLQGRVTEVLDLAPPVSGVQRRLLPGRAAATAWPDASPA